MKGFSQILDFIYYILVIGIIVFALIFFSIPGNFDKFKEVLKALTPIIFFASVLFYKVKRTASDINRDPDEDIELILKSSDKLILECVLMIVPILMLVWTMFLGTADINSIGQAIFVFIANLLVLKVIFRNRFNS